MQAVIRAVPCESTPVSPLPTDNTAGVYARRGGFSRQKQDLYLLPIVISDGGIPPMSSTNTLSIKVCGCDVNGALLSCNAEAYVLNAGLSTGALIAILACIVILLGKVSPRSPAGRALTRYPSFKHRYFSRSGWLPELCCILWIQSETKRPCWPPCILWTGEGADNLTSS